MRRITIILSLLALVLLPACQDEESPKSKAPSPQAQKALVESSYATCRLARSQYGKLVQAYRIRHDRYPKNLDELKAAGMIQGVIPCAGKGSYTIDDRGMIRCSVHEK